MSAPPRLRLRRIRRHFIAACAVGLVGLALLVGTLSQLLPLAERRRIDLAGLDAEIGRICAASLAVPRQAAPDIRARLQALLRDLSLLG